MKFRPANNYYVSSTILLLLVQSPHVLSQMINFGIPGTGTVTVYNVSTKLNTTQFVIQPAVHNFGGYIPGHFKGFVVNSFPENACEPVLHPPRNISRHKIDKELNWILLASNYDCTLQIKIYQANVAGFSAIIIHNTESNDTEEVIGTKKDLTHSLIPAYSVAEYAGRQLKEKYTAELGFYVEIIIPFTFDFASVLLWIIFGSVLLILLGGVVFTACQYCCETYSHRWCIERKRRLLAKAVEAIPVMQWTQQIHSSYETCVICFENFLDGDSLRILSCSHGFHSKCIEDWLMRSRRFCPICKRKFRFSRIFYELPEESDDLRIDTSQVLAQTSAQPDGGIAEETEVPKANDNNEGCENFDKISTVTISTTCSNNSLTSLDGSTYFSTEISFVDVESSENRTSPKAS